VGKSGSGKTTLMKCLYGLEDLLAGEILIGSEKVLGPSFNLIPGHEKIKLVSQEFAVLENHTVQENIFDRMIGYTDDAKQRRATKLLKLLELEPLRTSRAKHLSTGQKQRVAIARALAIMPAVLLLDEPFSNLDNLLSDKLFSFITEEIRKKKTAVILITHIPEEALKYADRIAIMEDGRLVHAGEKWQVYYHPKNKKQARLLGAVNALKPKDLEKQSPFKKRSSFYIRPDKLIQCQQSDADLNMTVIACTYNGKCFEILAETSAGSTVCVYAAKRLQIGKNYFFRIEA
jgi:ABC-type Fe3+/spermidine/putrescine transport system ATPase subunit